jgi:hypothetical protein
MKQNEGEFHLGNGDFINVKTSSNVTLVEQFVVQTHDGPISLNVKINADFATIDKKYHEIFFNVLCAKYMNKVSFGENPFSECRPIIKRKWWQFWKPKFTEQ